MTKKKTIDHYSGIGGQAVLEGVMMKNQDTYAVAVRKPDGKIEVKTEEYKDSQMDKASVHPWCVRLLGFSCTWHEMHDLFRFFL